MKTVRQTGKEGQEAWGLVEMEQVKGWAIRDTAQETGLWTSPAGAFWQGHVTCRTALALKVGPWVEEPPASLVGSESWSPQWEPL